MAGSGVATSAVEVVAGLTHWVTALDVEEVKLASPPYVTLRLAVPAAEKAMAQVAVGGTVAWTATAEHPEIGVELLVKATVPVGVPDPGEETETVAVRVTGWPMIEGLGEDESEVVVEALSTVSVRSGEEELAKLADPAKTAVTE